MRLKDQFCVATLLIFLFAVTSNTVTIFARQNNAKNPSPPAPKTALEQKSPIIESKNKNYDIGKEIHELNKQLRKLNQSQSLLTKLMLLQVGQSRVDRLSEKIFSLENELNNLQLNENTLKFRADHLETDLAVQSFLSRNDGIKVVGEQIRQQLEQLQNRRPQLEQAMEALRAQEARSKEELELLRNEINSSIREEKGKKPNTEDNSEDTTEEFLPSVEK